MNSAFVLVADDAGEEEGEDEDDDDDEGYGGSRARRRVSGVSLSPGACTCVKHATLDLVTVRKSW